MKFPEKWTLINHFKSGDERRNHVNGQRPLAHASPKEISLNRAGRLLDQSSPRYSL